MPVYVWEGKSASGKTVKGEIEAANVQQVYNTLKSQRITPNAKKIVLKSGSLERDIKIPGMGKMKKAKTKDVVIFTRQFATMIDAGLPLVQGIDILGRQHPSPVMKSALMGVKDIVSTGGTLAEGLAKYPKVFDDLYVNMVAAGETGGILDIILERLSVYLEKMDKLKSQVKTALIYPAVVVTAAVIVTSILLIFVIPTFRELFSGFGASLPAATRIVIAMSDALRKYGFIVAVALFIGFKLFINFAVTVRGQQVLHPIYLKLPVMGDLIKKVAVARFTRTLGTMLSSGVAITEALQICGRTRGNKVVEAEIKKVRAAIMEGKPIIEPLKGSQIFPSMVVSMIEVGESTGAMDAMLQKIADFYDEEVNNAVTALKQLIEPIMILVLGTIVGGLVVAMYLPIFKMGSIVGG